MRFGFHPLAVLGSFAAGARRSQTSVRPNNSCFVGGCAKARVSKPVSPSARVPSRETTGWKRSPMNASTLRGASLAWSFSRSATKSTFTGAPDSSALKPRNSARPVTGETRGGTAAAAAACVADVPAVPEAPMHSQSGGHGSSGGFVSGVPSACRRPSVTLRGTNPSTIALGVRLASLWSRMEPLSSARTNEGVTSSHIEYEMPRFTTTGGLMPAVDRTIVCFLLRRPSFSTSTDTSSVP